jgi:hypothetical protein
VLRRPRGAGRFAGACAVFTAALLLGACEGDNLFDSDTLAGEGVPVVEALTASAEIVEGTRLDVTIRVRAATGMKRVDVRFRRGAVKDQAFPIDGNPTGPIIVDAFVDVPMSAQDSVVVVEAVATDRLDRESTVVSRNVRILPSDVSSAHRRRVSDG